jgi:hypothetical protein
MIGWRAPSASLVTTWEGNPMLARSVFVVVALLLPGSAIGAAVITPGFTFTVSDGLIGPSGQGTHFHSSTGGDFGNPAGLAEVGGLFGQEEPRGLSEYDLAGLVSGGPAFVTFDVFSIFGLFGQSTGVFDIDIFAYLGNNAEDLSDYQAPATAFIGTFSTSGLSTGEGLSFDVAAVLDAAILDGDPSFGIRLQQSVHNTFGPAYTFNNFRLTTEPIPEPGTLLLLTSGMIGVALRRRASRSRRSWIRAGSMH